MNVSLGHLVMDLNHMLRPAKSPEKCNLQLLEQPADRLVSLFEQKTVKGWWPCTCEQNGQKIIAVSKTNTPRRQNSLHLQHAEPKKTTQSDSALTLSDPCCLCFSIFGLKQDVGLQFNLDFICEI